MSQYGRLVAVSRCGAAPLPGLVLLLVLLLTAPGLSFALQDPTRPPGYQPAAATPAPQRALTLDSILFSDHRRVAVIDGEALREGQSSDGIRVIRIFKTRVLVSESGRERVLHLETLPQVRETQ